MQPPLRMDYKDMQIVKAFPHDKTKNYIIKKFDNYHVIINKDKVSNKYKQAVFELSTELSNIIDESLKYYPRKYILSLVSNPDIPIGNQSFEVLLRGCFDNKRVGVDMLRSAYITNLYDNKYTTMKDKAEVAHKMRSSIAMASTVYHKISRKEESDEDLINDFVKRIKIQDKDHLKRMVLDIITAIRKSEE